MSEEYRNDYPNEPIGEGNPYYCCSFCKISDPEINGRLEGHSINCEWRLKQEQDTIADTIITEVLTEEKLIKHLTEGLEYIANQKDLIGNWAVEHAKTVLANR